ncbi:hypothetical protein DO97_02695 [Neosynechococcus sphagnicola sy1]|uniref:DZANK-type domain-containing protein n=2 Tax=Neosynechococcus TaxID=1501143 RepID=A0A098TL23_9CYAN|nr:hypothetical protein DO97_02695 [Neosynechococcus sphagnicola sy1]
MPSCPRCQQFIKPSVYAQAIACPTCQAPLKAFGHPGIPLHHAKGQSSLCVSCTYHRDNSCSFPQRPHARDCTLYRQYFPLQAIQATPPRSDFSRQLRLWQQRHGLWIAMVSLLAVSILVTLMGRR